MKPTPNSKTFCALPWVHTAVTATGYYRLCCKAREPHPDKVSKNRPHATDTNINAWWNSSYMNDVRKDQWNGIEREECRSCLKDEASTGFSKRLLENEKWANQVVGNEELQNDFKNLATNCNQRILKPISFDLRFGNKCNLKCRTCNPFNSHLIAQEWTKLAKSSQTFSQLNKKYKTNNMNWYESDFFWDQLKQYESAMQDIYVAGGEPTLIKENTQYLKNLVKRQKHKKIHYRINTNMVHLTDELLEILSQFNEVTFNCSIDGVGEKNTYIRYPSHWQKIVDNMNKLIEIDSIKHIVLLTTVGNYNILHVDEIFRWYLDLKNKFFQRNKFDVLTFGVNILHFPEFQQINLPDNLKQKALNKLDRVLAASDDPSTTELIALKNKIAHHEFNESYFLKFMNYNDELDEYRGTQFSQVFGPDFEEVRTSINEKTNEYPILAP